MLVINDKFIAKILGCHKFLQKLAWGAFLDPAHLMNDFSLERCKWNHPTKHVSSTTICKKGEKFTCSCSRKLTTVCQFE